MGIRNWFRSLWRRFLLALLVPVVLLAVLAIVSSAGQISGTAAAVTAALLFAVALLGMFYYQGRAIGRLESGKTEEVAEIERARDSAKAALTEVQTALEKEQAKRQETQLQLERERRRFLSVTNLQPILDLGVMEAAFRITEAYEIEFDENWKQIGGAAVLHEDEEEASQGDDEVEAAAGPLAKYAFIGAVTADFTGRFGFDLRNVQAEFDERTNTIRFTMPPIGFLGTKTFCAFRWVISHVLALYEPLMDPHYWWVSSDPVCLEQEKEFRKLLEHELAARLTRSPCGPVRAVSKSLEQVGIKIVQALLSGATRYASNPVESLLGPGKALLEVIRDLTAEEAAPQSADVPAQLPMEKRSHLAGGTGASD